MADFSPGLRLSDRYLLDRRVGAGALWLAHDELLGRAVAVRPAGWHDAGFAGTREECLSHIDTVWTDMRPRSVREATR